MDNLMNKIIRRAPDRMAEMHTHLINQIIKKKKFPEILKISKIIPILKKGKPKYDIDSYHPINNLACTEKIINPLRTGCPGNSLLPGGGAYGPPALTRYLWGS